MDISTTIKANAKTAEVMHPGVSTFDDPTILSQATAVFSTTFCNHRNNATFTNGMAMRLGIVATICVNGLRFLQGMSG
jgi:hypothetical protein